MVELKAENISKKIKKNIILNNISLYLTGGNVYGFVGRNGSGKTMLFRALSGLIKIDEGKIYYNGRKYIFKIFSIARYRNDNRKYRNVS